MKNLIHGICIFYYCLFAVIAGYAQNASGLKTINYTSTQYDAGFQNWDILQDKEQVMYMANSRGLLTFNGYYWSLLTLPNASVTRTLLLDNEGVLYIGAQNEFGYLSKSDHGLQYTSLLDKIPEKERQFNDIWNIVESNNTIFFREPHRIFVYNKEAKDIKILKPEGTWSFMGKIGQDIVAQDDKIGLLVYQNSGWKKIFDNSAVKNSIISSIVPYQPNSFLITTQDEGIFLLHGNRISPYTATAQSSLFKHIYAAKKLSNGNFLFGTISYGVITIKPDGTIVDIWNKKNGLLSNDIKAIYEDQEKNIWLAQQNGVSYISLNSPIRYISTDSEKEPTGYSSSYFNGRYWLGTSDGVYRSKAGKEFEKFEFDRIPGTGGQVWKLQNIQDKLMLAHDKGLFELQTSGAKRLYGNFGTWMIAEHAVSNGSQNYFVGTYNGILHLSQLENVVNPEALKMSGMDESIRFITYDSYSNSYWASHPNRGIYQIFINVNNNSFEKINLYGSNHGLPDTYHNYIFKINDQLCAGTKDGIYTYNNAEKKFMPHPQFYALTKGLAIQYLRNDEHKNIWIAAAQKVFVLKNKDSKYELLEIPELNGKIVGGHASINTEDLSHVLIGVNQGFIHLDFNKYNWKKPSSFFHKIISINTKDTLLSNRYKNENTEPYRISFQQNALRFEFGAIEYTYQQEIEFSYMLEGYDKGFSEWSTKKDKEYTNLAPGSYTFIVKSRFGNAAESDKLTYSFQVHPPWYRSIYAYLVYLIFLTCTLYMVHKMQQRKFFLKAEQKSKMHQLQLSSSEQEIVKLKNANLSAEVEYKNKELSALTLHMVKRAEVLNKLKTYIKDATKAGTPMKETLSTLLRMIRIAEKSQEDSHYFNQQFYEVNRIFFVKLQERFPNLTANDLKLCALLKMELSTKEIAQILNNSTKAVEIGRYRLRKKLDLDTAVKIHTFLNTV